MSYMLLLQSTVHASNAPNYGVGNFKSTSLCDLLEQYVHISKRVSALGTPQSQLEKSLLVLVLVVVVVLGCGVS